MTSSLRLRTLKACPLCGARTIKEFTTKRYHVRSLKENVAQTYAMCVACTFIFTKNPLTERSLETYYRHNTQERRAPTKTEKAYIEDQVAFLSSTVHIRAARVLEIGANNGAFLDRLHREGAAFLAYAEPNVESRRLLSEKPYLVDSTKVRGRTYDLVVLLHTLEHIVRPTAFIDAISRSLKEGGAIFVEVPDFTMQDDHTDELQFEHVNFFTEATLRKLFTACGLTVIASRILVTPEYSACPKYVVRMIARKATYAPRTPQSRTRALRVQAMRKQRAIRAINAYMRHNDASRVGIYTGSWLTTEVLQSSPMLRKRAVAIFDRDRKKHGAAIEGVTIVSPDMIKRHHIDLMLVLNDGFAKEIVTDLIRMGMPRAHIRTWADFL